VNFRTRLVILHQAHTCSRVPFRNPGTCIYSNLFTVEYLDLRFWLTKSLISRFIPNCSHFNVLYNPLISRDKSTYALILLADWGWDHTATGCTIGDPGYGIAEEMKNLGRKQCYLKCKRSDWCSGFAHTQNQDCRLKITRCYNKQTLPINATSNEEIQYFDKPMGKNSQSIYSCVAKMQSMHSTQGTIEGKNLYNTTLLEIFYLPGDNSPKIICNGVGLCSGHQDITYLWSICIIQNLSNFEFTTECLLAIQLHVAKRSSHNDLLSLTSPQDAHEHCFQCCLVEVILRFRPISLETPFPNSRVRCAVQTCRYWVRY
jgi:hypothetical protein